MIQVFAAVLFSVLVSVLLKLMPRHGINAAQAVTWNYLVAALLCLLVFDPSLATLLEPGAPFRFLNHSCEPNCELINYTPDDAAPHEYEVYVCAMRKIKEGEQLTIDYAWAAEAAIRCGCQAKTCRGWIVSADQLEEVLLREAMP